MGLTHMLNISKRLNLKSILYQFCSSVSPLIIAFTAPKGFANQKIGLPNQKFLICPAGFELRTFIIRRLYTTHCTTEALWNEFNTLGC